ncbi:MAG: MerR family transcriptional regulator [Gammaproteobacteria bacterium]|jgi:DNA-binding transcriptional MerR regulator|nr:MerR family transcriptional regulator [Gammaproteobacteria bacterium]|tara:strand:+ start:234 stop:686 length:453 start_codon:yes stop_codon:yes gene_type:complete
MRVKELAQRSGVAPHVIRYYTRVGLLHPARERGNRYRAYALTDVQRVRFIRRARWLGFNLSDVGTILADADQGLSPCPETRHLIQLRARENHRRLMAVGALQARMEDAIAQWSRLPDRLPDHASLCYLIDLVAEADDQGEDDLMRDDLLT